MEQFLRALLVDLERRCTALKDRLDAVPDSVEVRDHVLAAYSMIERVRREVVRLLADPSLGSSVLLPNHLQQYRRWHERIRLVESFPLVFVERFAEPDRRLSALGRRLAAQVGWPLPPPLVGAFSNQYYWTFPAFNVVCLPAGEETTCLGWADLCHELGHILLVAHQAALVDDFGQDLVGYIRSEQLQVVSGQRPPEYQQLYGLLLAQWQDQWLGEFVSDMVAVYLVGPSFGWQHVRL